MSHLLESEHKAAGLPFPFGYQEAQSRLRDSTPNAWSTRGCLSWLFCLILIIHILCFTMYAFFFEKMLNTLLNELVNRPN